MQSCIIRKHQNSGQIYLSRLLVLSQLYDVVANRGRAGFPVGLQLTIVISGGTHASQARIVLVGRCCTLTCVWWHCMLRLGGSV